MDLEEEKSDARGANFQG
jgi:hypothetical protein